MAWASARPGGRMDSSEPSAIFGSFDLFADFSVEQLRLLDFVSEDVFLESGNVLYTQGDMADGAYILVSGQVSASEEASGSEGAFAVDPPALIGELGLMLKRPRTSTITATRASELIFVPRESFLKLLRADPALAESVAAQLRAELLSYLDSIGTLRDRFASE